MTVGGVTGAAMELLPIPTWLNTLVGTDVTAFTTDAGAGVTGVYERLGGELDVSLTMTRAATMTMTRPTAPQASKAPETRRGGGGACGRAPGRGLFPPPPAPPPPEPRPVGRDGPAGALVETARLWALLRSLALWVPWPFCGFGRLPPAFVLPGPVPVFAGLVPALPCSRAISPNPVCRRTGGSDHASVTGHPRRL